METGINSAHGSRPKAHIKYSGTTFSPNLKITTEAHPSHGICDNQHFRGSIMSTLTWRKKWRGQQRNLCTQFIIPRQRKFWPWSTMKATSDPDTLYFHKAIRTPDCAKFIEAMEKEISDNNKNDNFQLVHRRKIPKGCTVLPSVWQLRRKRHLDTGKIKKYKARINVDGSCMIKYKHYDQTYSPVASWAIICLLMTIAAVHC